MLPSDMIDPVTDEDIEWVCSQMGLGPLDAPRKAFLKSLTTIDVSACPGSGKTTLIVAKLAILARKWKFDTRGICVLSHTNAAREEIEKKLGQTEVGQKLLTYPHSIETIHGFVNKFLAIPWLRTKGHQITAIDNDLTYKARYRALGPRGYRQLMTFLDNKHKSFESLRLESTDFSNPLPNGLFSASAGTNSHSLASSALGQAAQKGYFCHDEMFLFGRSLLSECPEISQTLRYRFPIVLVDEMQDTSKDQNEFLQTIFDRESPSICVHRVGDANQEIFDFGGEALEHPFPDEDRLLCIESSFRFDASIAKIATPIAFTPVQPAGLVGNRLPEIAGGFPHTIFIFPDRDVSRVLPAFGAHVLAHLPDTLLNKFTVSAVGSVHARFDDIGPGHNHFPKSVSHYWEGYQTNISTQGYRPGHLAEYFHLARAFMLRDGALYNAVNDLAFGILHLGNLLSENGPVRVNTRKHAHIERLLHDRATIRDAYRTILHRFLIGREDLTPTAWDALLPSLMEIAAALNGGNPRSNAADSFLEWRDSVVQVDADQPAQGSLVPNAYRHTEGERSVDVCLGSIHSVKGQTHAATLILETFNYDHVLDSLMPWLLGKQANGQKKTTDKIRKRLLQTYVAMTRPTHLLCLAMRRSSLDGGDGFAVNRENLIQQGWIVRELVTPTNNP